MVLGVRLQTLLIGVQDGGAKGRVSSHFHDGGAKLSLFFCFFFSFSFCSPLLIQKLYFCMCALSPAV